MKDTENRPRQNNVSQARKLEETDGKPLLSREKPTLIRVFKLRRSQGRRHGAKKGPQRQLRLQRCRLIYLYRD